MRNKFFTLFYLLPLALTAQQNNLSPEMLLSFKRVGVPVVNTDGSMVAYTVEEVNMQANKGFKDLYIQNVSGITQGRNITNTPEVSEYSPQFDMVSKAIYYLKNTGNGPQVFKYDLGSALIKQITDVKDGINSFYVSAGGHYLLYTSDVKTTQSLQDMYTDAPQCKAMVIDDLLYRHWDSWDDYMSTHPFLAKLTGEVITGGTDLMGKDKAFDAEDLSMSTDEKYIVYVSKQQTGKEWAYSTNTDVFLYETENGVIKNISADNKGYDQHPVFSPKGHELVWERMATPGFESDKTDIIRYNFSDQSVLNLSAAFAEGASNLCWNYEMNKIYFTAYMAATCQIFCLDLSGLKITQISSGDHDFHSVACAGNLLIGAKTEIQLPQEICTVNPIDGKILQLTQVNTEILKEIKKCTIEKRMVKTTDGKDMLVWIVKPPDMEAGKKYPALLYCQGGPQSAVSCYFSYRWNPMLMASQGYVVVAPNRRGLPGFGKEWNNSISGDWGGQAMKDYLSAIDDAANLPYVDKARLGAVGASYGGYSVYWLAGNHQKRFKTFIAHCGLFNLESWYNTTEEMFFANHDIEGPFWKNELSYKYDKFSPHNFIQNWDTPLMVIHGEKDFRVPVGEGMQAFGAARNRDLKSRFLYFPDEGHWVLKPQNALVWHREFYRWLKETL